MIRFTLITGPMYAGKSTTLAKMLRTDIAADRRVSRLHPASDTRKGRQMHFINALPVSLITDPFGHGAATLMRRAQTIGADEVQFIAPWMADFLDALSRQTEVPDVHVIAAGLDLKADGTPWPGMAALADLADEHIPLTATCTICGAPATMTLATAPLPADGIRPGDDGYQPACKHCWEKHYAAKQRRKETA